jgi:hypothetical protein
VGGPPPRHVPAVPAALKAGYGPLDSFSYSDDAVQPVGSSSFFATPARTALRTLWLYVSPLSTQTDQAALYSRITFSAAFLPIQ